MPKGKGCPFYRKFSLDIAAKRLAHLATLGLSLEGRRVLEPGCGVGRLTEFFEKRGCVVISTEGRSSNVRLNLRHHAWRKGSVFVADLNQPGSHDSYGSFDVVFLYGVLYHLGEPARVLTELSRLCSQIFLIDTRVNPIDNGSPNCFRENLGPDQTLDGRACKPGRDWILAQLREHFEYAYISTKQPHHKWYPLSWPAYENARAVFVASRSALELPTLSEKLLMRQERC